MPGYEPSNTMGAEKRKVQADYMAEQALPQRVHDPLAGTFQSDNLKKIRDKPDDDHRQENDAIQVTPFIRASAGSELLRIYLSIAIWTSLGQIRLVAVMIKARPTAIRTHFH